MKPKLLWFDGVYRDYLQSDAWKLKVDAARARAGFRCEAVVNGRRCSNRCTQGHHLHYRTLGHERPSDIMVVCDDCHRRLHGLLWGAPANDNQLELPLAPKRGVNDNDQFELPLKQKKKA